MKKWIWSIVAIIVVICVGGWLYTVHSNNVTAAFTNNIKNGKTEIRNGNYTAAKDNFNDAVNEKPDSKEANGLLNQTKQFIDGNNETKEREFNSALDSYESASETKHGYSYLTNLANKKVKSTKAIIENRAKFHALYKKAIQQHNDGQFASSQSTIEVILNNDLIKQDYYSDIRKNAQSLAKINQKSIQGDKKAQANKKADKATNNDTKSNSENTNVYENPAMYSNRFSPKAPASTNNSSNTNTITNNSNSVSTGTSEPTPSNDPYDVYTNPAEYQNRWS